MKFPDKLIALRKKAGWSQEELAERLDVSRQSVSKWEGAQSMPDIDKILQLSSLFGVTTDYLLKDAQDDPQPAAAEAPSPLPRVTLAPGDFTREHKAVNGRLTAAYWLVVVAIFLWYTFGPEGNGQPQYSWFIWAIAGVIYAACVIAVKALVREKV